MPITGGTVTLPGSRTIIPSPKNLGIAMADTRILKSKIEDYVRDWLKVKFGQPFHSKFLALCGVEGKPRTHEFDAVSEDGAIVCSIKTASWKTSGKKRGSGKVHGAYMELYFLDHVCASQRYLVLTDPEFVECFKRETAGRLGATIIKIQEKSGAGGGNRTIRAYSFCVTYCKHTHARTAQPAVCPPYVQNHVQTFEGPRESSAS